MNKLQMYHLLKLLLLLVVQSATVYAHRSSGTFLIENNSTETLWIGIYSDGSSLVSNGGFVLIPGGEHEISTSSNWHGSIWARTGCINITESCLTGDCHHGVECMGQLGTPPVTYAEFSLGYSTDSSKYKLNLKNGYNVGVKIQPLGESGCKSISCVGINEDCPEKLKLKDSIKNVIGCHSSCTKFNTGEYCCTGEYSSPDKCIPANWTINSVEYFKKKCPNAVTYEFDNTPTFKCKSKKFRIIFEV